MIERDLADQCEATLRESTGRFMFKGNFQFRLL